MSKPKIPRVLLDHKPHPLRLYRTNRLARLLDVDPSTIWRWRKIGVLPPPSVLGGIRGWTEEQVKQVLEQQQRGSSDAP